MLIQLGTDDTELTGGICRTGTQVDLAGDEVKVDPAAVSADQDALGTQNHAKLALIQGFQSLLHGFHGKLLVGLHTPGGEHLVGMVMVVIVVMAAAGAMLIMVMVVMVMIVIVTAAITVVVVAVVMVFVAAAVAVVAMVMVFVAAAVVVVAMVVVAMVVVMFVTFTMFFVMVMMFGHYFSSSSTCEIPV